MYIDFETYSEADLKVVGAWLYAKHPSTQILCIGYQDGLESECGVFVPDGSKDNILYWNVLNRLHVCGQFHAHNAGFEQAIWHHICHKRWGWPEIPSERWTCTAVAAASHALPRKLEKVATVLQLPQTKDVVGHRVMLQLSKPKKPTKSNPSTRWHPWDVPEKYEKLYEYCKQDIRTEKALGDALRPLPPDERRLWELDQKINLRGIRADREAVLAAIRIRDEYGDGLRTELQKITGGVVTDSSKLKQMHEWIMSRGIVMPDMQAATVDAYLTRALPADVLRVLTIRSELSMSSTAKYDAFLANMDDDDRIRDLYLFHGASTGRWTGRRVQLQNVPRGTIKDKGTLVSVLKMGQLDTIKLLYPSVMEALSSALRGMFISSEGKNLFVGDYAAIEARVVMWLAGEEGGLEAFRQGQDIYKVMAAHIYKTTPDKIDAAQRALGKQAVLGCGFGMGATKFQATCAKYKIEIEMTTAEAAVYGYRGLYAKVPKFWYAIEDAARRAVLTPGKLTQIRDIAFQIQGKFLYCRLPSGRCLAYPYPKIIDDQITYEGEDTYTRQWVRLKTYGGKLVENITQATARDIMAAAMFCVEDAGYEIVMHTHDEIVCEKPDGQLDEYLKLMVPELPWAKGLPIAVEGWKGKRYRK